MMPAARCGPGLRAAGEARQLGERDVDAEGSRAAAVGAHAFDDLGWQGSGIEQVEVQELRVDAGGDGAGADLRAVGEHDAAYASAAYVDLAHFAVGAQLDAEPACLRCDGVADGAHAAHRMAPHPALAVDLAELVVQQHVAGAGVIRAGVIADDGVEAVGGLDAFGFEPVIEQVRGALREQRQQVAPRFHVETLEAEAEAQCRKRITPAAAGIGRRLQHHCAQHVGQALDHRREGGQACGIARREARDFALRARDIGADAQVRTLAQRQEVGDRPRQYPQAVLGEPQVAQHLGLQQAHGVGSDRVAESGMKLRRHRRAAQDRPALEHQRLQAGACQIAGCDQAVMAATHDDHVIVEASRSAHTTSRLSPSSPRAARACRRATVPRLRRTARSR